MEGNPPTPTARPTAIPRLRKLNRLVNPSSSSPPVVTNIFHAKNPPRVFKKTRDIPRSATPGPSSKTRRAQPPPDLVLPLPASAASRSSTKMSTSAAGHSSITASLAPLDDSLQSFFTPNHKLVKPLETAFLSTGLMTRRNRSKKLGDHPNEPNSENRPIPQHIPETPCKRPSQASPFVMPRVPDTPIAFDLPSPTQSQTRAGAGRDGGMRKHRASSIERPVGRKRLNLDIVDFGEDLFDGFENNDDLDNVFLSRARPAGLRSPAPLGSSNGKSKLASSAAKKPNHPRRSTFSSSSPASATSKIASSSRPPSQPVFTDTNPPVTPPKRTLPVPLHIPTSTIATDPRCNIFLSSSSPDYDYPATAMKIRPTPAILTQLRSPDTSPIRTSPRRRLGSDTANASRTSLFLVALGSDDTDEDDMALGDNESEPRLTPAAAKLKMMALYARRKSLSTPAMVAANHAYVTAYPHLLTKAYFEELRSGLAPTAPHLTTSSSTQATTNYFETRFSVRALAGAGEFADVYRVKDKTEGSLYAVKRTKWPFTGVKDRLSQIEEVEHMWAVGAHLHCVRLIGAWEQCGHLFIQTELCEGGSLYAFLEEHCQDSALDEQTIWRILGEIASGLHHIHNHARLLHLDLKPANILITGNGVLKIGDFGMATRWPVTTDIEREGDRTYMAPELLRGQYDRPADVFSLGLILLEMVANVILPENGDEWQRLRAGDLSGCELEQVSSEMRNLIAAMLRPEPEARVTVRRVMEVVMRERGKSKASRGALEMVRGIRRVERKEREDGIGDAVERVCTPVSKRRQ